MVSTNGREGRQIKVLSNGWSMVGPTSDGEWRRVATIGVSERQLGAGSIVKW